MTQPRGRLSLLLALTTTAVLLACLVVSLGAFTRLVHAGLGCPDWPGCYGHLTWPSSDKEVAAAEALFPESPVEQSKTWPEMVHRYFAGTLGLMVLAITILLLLESRRMKRACAGNIDRNSLPLKQALGICLVILVQAAFGMWTVTLKLWPQVVTAHLLGGFATLSLIWLLRLRLSDRLAQIKTAEERNEPPIEQLRPHHRPAQLSLLGHCFSALIIVVILQVALGGWTSANYAALACPDFPTCHGQWLPEADFQAGLNISQTIGPNYLGGLLDGPARTAIHFSHRLGALLVLIFTIACLYLSRPISSMTKYRWLLATVVAAQVGLGIANVVFSLPLSIAVAHNGVGALLLLTVITARYRLYHLAKAQSFAASSTKTTIRGIHHEPVSSSLP